MLPWTGTIGLLQSDGSTVTLAPAQVVSGTVTLSIPAVSSSATLSSNGLTIVAQPGPVQTPSSGGLSGFSGLINALEGLAGSAGSIADTLGQISDQGALWAAGSLSDVSFSTSVDSLLNTANSGLSSWVATVNGVFDDFNDEVYELTEDGLRRVFPARTGAIEEFDILKALRKLTTNLVNIRTDVISKIKDNWTQGTIAAAVLAAAVEALRNFADYPWANEKPQPSNVTSSTSSSSAAPTLYVFGTKTGTNPSVFQSYIKTLPDGGQGDIIQYPNVPWQSYLTNLTAQQALDVAKQSFVEYISTITEDNATDYGAVRNLGQNLQERVAPSLNLDERQDSDMHLRLISTKNQQDINNIMGAALPNYLFDPSLGQGQTIYIIDTGCRLSHTVGLSAQGWYYR